MKDLTNLKTYIIDSEDPHEIDDAISLEISNDYIKKLWVHISNPCSLFVLDSEIDLEARKNNSSLYLTEKYIPMLPKKIIDKANLQQNKISNTISASINFNNDGSISKYEIVEANIKPKYQLTYEEANEIIELEPNEEYELIEIKNLLINSLNYRKRQGAINFENSSSKFKLLKDKLILINLEKTISQVMISEAMILMGYVTSLYLIENNLPAAYRSQKINCEPQELLNKYKDSEIRFILLKQYLGKSYISTKPDRHHCLGIPNYVQCTSPLRRYLDLIIQRQVYNKLRNYDTINLDFFIANIDYSRRRQIEINNIYKNDKLKYLIQFFNNENKNNYKIIFVKWINFKKNIALVFFPEYLIEILITFYVSIDVYSNKVYKVKYNKESHNLLEFIY